MSPGARQSQRRLTAPNVMVALVALVLIVGLCVQLVDMMGASKRNDPTRQVTTGVVVGVATPCVGVAIHSWSDVAPVSVEVWRSSHVVARTIARGPRFAFRFVLASGYYVITSDRRFLTPVMVRPGVRSNAIYHGAVCL